MKIAELFTTISVNTSKFDSKIGRVQGSLKRVDATISKIATAGKIAFVGIAAAIGAGVTAFAKFEEQMSTVKALTKGTAEQMAAMTEQARKLGRETAFSATEAAMGMTQLAQAGFKVEEITKAMPGLLSLAAAGSLELAEASEITAATLKGFGLAAEDSGKVADLLAFAANNANTNVSELGQAISFVAPVANAMGVSIEGTVAGIQALSDAGIKATRAGTGMAAILTRFSGASKPANDFLKKFNISLKDTDGKMKNLPKIIEDVNKGLKDLNKAEKTAEIMSAFGLRAGPAMAVLLARGGAALRDMKGNLESSAGTAAEVASVKLDNLMGSFKILQSVVTDAAIELGSKFAPSIQAIVGKIQAAIPAVKKWIESFDAKQIKAALGATKDLVVNTFTAVQIAIEEAMKLDPLQTFLSAWDTTVSNMQAAWEQIDLLGTFNAFLDESPRLLEVLHQISDIMTTIAGINLGNVVQAGASLGVDLTQRLKGASAATSLSTGSFSSDLGSVGSVIDEKTQTDQLSVQKAMGASLEQLVKKANPAIIQ